MIAADIQKHITLSPRHRGLLAYAVVSARHRGLLAYHHPLAARLRGLLAYRHPLAARLDSHSPALPGIILVSRAQAVLRVQCWVLRELLKKTSLPFGGAVVKNGLSKLELRGHSTNLDTSGP